LRLKFYLNLLLNQRLQIFGKFNSEYIMKRMLLFSIIVLSIAMFTGCGYYSFSGSALPSHIRTVAVPMFENKTSEFGVREDLTDALVDEFTQDNTLKVVDRRTADSMVRGDIVNIREQAGAYTQAEQVKEIRVYITVAVAFEDLKKKKIIWEESITQWGTYDPDLAPGQAGSSREDAIKEAVEKIVSDIFNKTVSGW